MGVALMMMMMMVGQVKRAADDSSLQPVAAASPRHCPWRGDASVERVCVGMAECGVGGVKVRGNGKEGVPRSSGFGERFLRLRQ